MYLYIGQSSILGVLFQRMFCVCQFLNKQAACLLTMLLHRFFRYTFRCHLPHVVWLPGSCRSATASTRATARRRRRASSASASSRTAASVVTCALASRATCATIATNATTRRDCTATSNSTPVFAESAEVYGASCIYFRCAFWIFTCLVWLYDAAVLPIWRNKDV